MVRDMQPDLARMRQAAGNAFSTATDLADWLVRVLGLPFRTAHHVTGRLVAKAESRGVDLADLSLSPTCGPKSRGLPTTFLGVLTVDASIASRTSHGGTAPANVSAQAARAGWQLWHEVPCGPGRSGRRAGGLRQTWQPRRRRALPTRSPTRRLTRPIEARAPGRTRPSCRHVLDSAR